ncbi:MAG: WecB/TagA/CpsF family glycosyltransferase [Elusimicrobia bacterium]|nr:WecB/TagA/CpsF family glycosyltransferase [Elusimicrobiota bacterium]
MSVRTALVENNILSVRPLRLDRCESTKFFYGRMNEARDLLIEWAQGPRPRFHASLNANALYWAHHDALFRQALREADLVTPDGDSILLMGKRLGFPVAQKIAGIELAESLLSVCRFRRWGVCFVGRRAPALERLRHIVRQRYPGLPVLIEQWRDGAGFAEQLGERIRGENIRILLAGLPMPQQEIWLWRHRHILGAPLSMGIGGAFEVWAGLRRRAPLAWRQRKLEWLHRFLQEPWRRFGPMYRATFWLGAQLLSRRMVK